MTIEPQIYMARMWQKTGTQGEWAANDDILAPGEFAIQYDEDEPQNIGLKLGRGLHWSETPFIQISEALPTDLGYAYTPQGLLIVTSSTGDDVTIPLATTTTAGLLPARTGAAGTFLTVGGDWAVPPGVCDLGYDSGSRLLTSSTGQDVTLPLVGTVVGGTPVAGLQTASEAARLAETGSPTFAGLTVTGTANLSHIHGALAGPLYHHVRNDSGTPLAALTPYRAIGTQGATDRALIVAARADSAALMPASGILSAALADNADGHGVVAGEILGVSTVGLTSGAPLYVATAGGLTPTAPAERAQIVAIVGRVHATTGSVIVQIGTVRPTAGDVGADPAGTAASAVTAHAAASGAHTAAQVGADPAGTAAAAITTHLQAAPRLTTQQAAAAAPVQAVALSAPTGWSTNSTNSAGSVTLTLGLPSGSSLVSSTDRTSWDQASTERLRWDGGSTSLNAATGRTSLGLGTAAVADATSFTPATLTVVSVAYAATVNIDFAACNGSILLIELTGNLQLTFSNIATGRMCSVSLKCDATARNLTFPASAPFLGTKPSSIAAGRRARVSFECLGSTEASVECGYAVQQ